MRFWSAVWLIGVATFSLASAAPGRATELASYRAVYDLSIDDSGDVASDAAVSGRMVVEFIGSACSGYHSKMRIVTEGEDGDGNAQLTDARTDSEESGNGRFAFKNEVYVNQVLTEQPAGVATRGSDGVSIDLSKPGKKHVSLGRAVVFPTEQLKRVLAAADAGEHFVAMDLFDGSQDGELVYATAVVIGKKSLAADDYGDDALVADAGFAGLPHWPVTVSYFEKDRGTDDAPDYVSSFVLYANGIGRKLRIDYGKFALNGQLSHLEMLPTPKC